MLVSTRMIPKLEALLGNYNRLRFADIAAIPMQLLETKERPKRMPEEGAWRDIPPGATWGGSAITGWFQGTAEIPRVARGRRVFVHAKLDGEAALFVDGQVCGVFDENHRYVSAVTKAKAGGKLAIALEAYSGQSFPGVDPYSEPRIVAGNSRAFGGVWLALEREDVSAFYFDLRVLLSLAKALDEHSLRKHKLIEGLEQVWLTIRALPEEVPEEDWRPRLADARRIMKPLLASRNAPTTPSIAILAHSHLDTAWLWPVAETRRKCYRTFSSVANLMEQYREVIFIQSAPVHLQMVKEDQPELFERIRKLVRKGRWEPNGAAWVEPDCNLTSGESLVRQFLFGIQWTRKELDYTSDMFWQPDVFGYSAALPQILRGFGIKYFCTTKMSWNDTTRFPYDTFEWQGADGSRVLAHLNHIHYEVEPKELIDRWNWSQHKDSETRRLAAYGWGDGGGGPTMETMEMARRVEDLEGCPRTYYTTVSAFMRGLDKERQDWPVWTGELYLEAHRGTLTSIGEIKRANRKTELQLRDAELLNTHWALCGGSYPSEELRAVWKELLLNQFHDILPGSSIACVNDEAKESYRRLLKATALLSRRAAEGIAAQADPAGSRLCLYNTLSWERAGEMEVPDFPKGKRPAGPSIQAQTVTAVTGEKKTILHGVALPPLGAAAIDLQRGSPPKAPSPFKLRKNILETPHASIRFDKLGRIVSCVLKSTGRDAVLPGGAFNTFYCGEDVPGSWDSWDIDMEQEKRMRPETRLVKREVVADGPLQFRLRSEWKIGAASTLKQDTIFHAHSPQISFETVVDWQEKHQLLKAGFDVNVLTETARHEMQFCHVERPTHRNYPQDRARFEVPCHRWSDLSDEGFGVAILNDCKYGISTHGHDVRLTLLKSGTHPDERADNGHHVFSYAALPHEGRFSVPTVLRPAAEFNVQPLAIGLAGAATIPPPLFHFDSGTVIVETVKWAEKGNAFVIRLYEAGKRHAKAALALPANVTRLERTNMMEEAPERIPLKNGNAELHLKPFEIVTLKCHLGREGRS